MDWETSFSTYINPSPICGCEHYLVAALACFFSKSTTMSFMGKRYGSQSWHGSAIYRPLPTDSGISSFLKTILANGVKGEPIIQSLKLSFLNNYKSFTRQRLTFETSWHLFQFFNYGNARKRYLWTIKTISRRKTSMLKRSMLTQNQNSWFQICGLLM